MPSLRDPRMTHPTRDPRRNPLGDVVRLTTATIITNAEVTDAR